MGAIQTTVPCVHGWTCKSDCGRLGDGDRKWSSAKKVVELWELGGLSLL